MSSHPFDILQAREGLRRSEKGYIYICSLASFGREVFALSYVSHCYPEFVHHVLAEESLISLGGLEELAIGMEFNKHCLQSFYISMRSPCHPRDQLTTNLGSLGDTFLSLSIETLKGK